MQLLYSTLVKCYRYEHECVCGHDIGSDVFGLVRVYANDIFKFHCILAMAIKMYVFQRPVKGLNLDFKLKVNVWYRVRAVVKTVAGIGSMLC